MASPSSKDSLENLITFKNLHFNLKDLVIRVSENMRNDRENVIVKKTFNFSLDILEYVDILESKRTFVVANQVTKSGTSVGANTREAQNAESKADFIHKFKIVAKEADEVQYWLDLCEASRLYPNPPEELFKNLQDIVNIVSKIIATSKR